MRKFRLVQVGYPFEHANWFGGVAAAEFEDTFFESKGDAEKKVDLMCRDAGTDNDSNYNRFKPIVLTIGEFNARYGGESEDVFFW